GAAASRPARSPPAAPASASRSPAASSRRTMARSRWPTSRAAVRSPSASRWPERSAVATDSGYHGGQRVGTPGPGALVRFDGQPFPYPVLEAADHLAHRVAEPGKLHRSSRSPPARPRPALRDDGRALRNERGGATRDIASRQVQGAGDMSPGPRVVTPGVDENEARVGLEGSVHIRYVGFEVELGAEVSDCCHAADARGSAARAAGGHPGTCGDRPWISR